MSIVTVASRGVTFLSFHSRGQVPITVDQTFHQCLMKIRRSYILNWWAT